MYDFFNGSDPATRRLQVVLDEFQALLDSLLHASAGFEPLYVGVSMSRHTVSISAGEMTLWDSEHGGPTGVMELTAEDLLNQFHCNLAKTKQQVSSIIKANFSGT